MIEYLPALHLAILALKAAKDIIPHLAGHQDRCRALVKRCEELIVTACSIPSNASQTTLDSQLKVVRDACTSVKETTLRLSEINPGMRVLKKQMINDEFSRCEAQLRDAFDTFNVSAQLSHARQQEELAQTLQQDKDVTLAYLDTILKKSQAMARELPKFSTISPLDRFDQQPQILERRTVYYTPPLTPASSSSWYIEPDELHDIADGPTFTEGTVGRVLGRTLRDEVVAVKYLYEDVSGILLLNKNNKKKLEKSALKWVKIAHPNVCQFLGVCLEVGTEGAFLVTEYCSNGDIMNYIRSYPEANILALLHQVSKGMRHLHAIDIIHCNLKPNNILVHHDHRVVIHDYELARLKDDATMWGSTSTHHIYGNWNYMSPEYLKGKTDFPCDVYSFAMSTWQMYTGCVPYSKVDWRELRQRMVSSRPERPGSMSDPLWLHIQCWWAAEPSRRPTFSEIEPALNSFLEPDPGRIMATQARRATRPRQLAVEPLSALQVEPSTEHLIIDPVTPLTPVHRTPAIALSETSRTAISKVMFALSSPVSFEKLAIILLGYYPSWVKVTPEDRQSVDRVDRGLYGVFQDMATRSAVKRYLAAVKEWIDNIPHFKGEIAPLDPRRTLLFVAAVTIMAEHSYVQMARSPRLHVDSFVRHNLARSDLKDLLEKRTRQIWAEHQASGFYGVAAIAADLSDVVESGFDLLNTSS